MLIKIKTVTRLPGDHKRGNDPDTPIFHGFETRKHSNSSASLITRRLSR